MPRFARASGILLHPSSLPGPHGIGDLGRSTLQFIDALAGAGQSLWQLLPLTPTGYGDSPYAAPSALAGNPLLVALGPLVEAGLLREDDVEPLTSLPTERVDFHALILLKRRVLRQAHHRFRAGDGAARADFERFADTERAWLDDFALFTALHDAAGRPWTEWEPDLRDRDPGALRRARLEHADSVDFHCYVQYLFASQWASVRQHARGRGVQIIGDVPIFVAHDSADVWANRRLFKLDDRGCPTVVAGVPPDYFSHTGQLWGNPLYDWPRMAQEEYAWWAQRFRQLLHMVDIVRIDHFRGFQAAWEVPASASTAETGTWVPGPGAELFTGVAHHLGGPAPVIAEDLGLITDDVRRLLAETGFPGMKVLQFAFGGGWDNLYLPHRYDDPNYVVYTGTHDNDTTRGWFDTAPEQERDRVRLYLGTDGRDIAWTLIRAALASVADLAIVPLQDVLDLGSEARMNTPGRSHGNWGWRATDTQMRQADWERLAQLTRMYGRSAPA